VYIYNAPPPRTQRGGKFLFYAYYINATQQRTNGATRERVQALVFNIF